MLYIELQWANHLTNILIKGVSNNILSDGHLITSKDKYLRKCIDFLLWIICKLVISTEIKFRPSVIPEYKYFILFVLETLETGRKITYALWPSLVFSTNKHRITMLETQLIEMTLELNLGFSD